MRVAQSPRGRALPTPIAVIGVIAVGRRDGGGQAQGAMPRRWRLGPRQVSRPTWHGWPARADDRLELRAEQVVVGADQREEGLVGVNRVPRGPGGAIGGHRFTHRQASMAWLVVACSLMAILRGLACSATGIAGEHAAVVAGLDVLGVEVVAEDELPAEHPAGAFGGDQLGVAGPGRPFGLDRHDVALDVQVDRVRRRRRAGRTRRGRCHRPARRPSASPTGGPGCRRCRTSAG